MKGAAVLAIAAAGTIAAAAWPTRSHGGVATFRVCADPNNLPFSNERGEGFENRIASLLASDLGERVEYTWWAQRRGFVRNTLNARSCDVILGVHDRSRRMANEKPRRRRAVPRLRRSEQPAVLQRAW